MRTRTATELARDCWKASASLHDAVSSGQQHDAREWLVILKQKVAELEKRLAQ